jgi:hypothetical protein
MIPWEPRRSWLALWLAGLEMSCLVPVFVALNRGAWGLNTLAVWAGFWGVQCLWILTVDLLSAARSDDAGERQGGLSESQVTALTFLAILGSSLILVRVLLYPPVPVGNLGWVSTVLRQLVVFERGLSAELLIILTNILLWQRALRSGAQNLHFRSLATRVRRLWFLSLVAAVYAMSTTGVDLTAATLVGFPLGLLSLVVGQTDEKATAAGSVGRPLGGRHMAELALIVLVVWGLGLTLLAAPAGWLAAVLDTVLGVIFLVVMQGLLVLVFLLYPIILEAVGFFIRTFGGSDITPPGLREPGVLLAEDVPLIGAITQLPPWVLDLLQLGALLLVLVGAALIVALVWKAVRPRRRGTAQHEQSRWALPDGSFLRQGLARVKDALALARQMGIGQPLLAATSVRNIYANLTRLATQRGYPRQKHQPPDRYMEELVKAFAGFEQPLQRITAAYMRVHYGDHLIERAELEQIQSDYREIRKAIET